MELNADFSKRVSVHAGEQDWIPSPMAGVERRMLDRIGDEVARATSIVKYDPGSAFSPHNHDGGEEFLVLEGIFQDDYGDFTAGTYVRNPPTTSHKPSSDGGCVIFVKLWQFDTEDRNQFSVDTTTAERKTDPGRPGVESLMLHSDEHEDVSMEWWDPAASFELNASGGMEILVIKGSFFEGDEQFQYQSLDMLSHVLLLTLQLSLADVGAVV